MALLHALERANHAVDRWTSRHLAAEGLSPLDAHTILVIAEHGSSPLVQVRGGLGRRGSTMTAVLDRLERRGFLRRAPASGDRRALDVEVTAAGRALAARVAEAWRGLEDEIRRELGPAGYAAATEALSRTAALLSGAGASPER